MNGAEIKAWRESLGLSAAEFGRRLGFSQQAVAAWETDENPVPPVIDVLRRQIDENGQLKQMLRRITGKPMPQIIREINHGR
jgi:DNA-binding transcriptional regulator YiaG